MVVVMVRVRVRVMVMVRLVLLSADVEGRPPVGLGGLGGVVAEVSLHPGGGHAGGGGRVVVADIAATDEEAVIVGPGVAELGGGGGGGGGGAGGVARVGRVLVGVLRVGLARVLAVVGVRLMLLLQDRGRPIRPVVPQNRRPLRVGVDDHAAGWA